MVVLIELHLLDLANQVMFPHGFVFLVHRHSQLKGMSGSGDENGFKSKAKTNNKLVKCLEKHVNMEKRNLEYG